MGLHSLTLVVDQRLSLDVERYETTIDLRVAPRRGGIPHEHAA
jgi:hypothetical protein